MAQVVVTINARQYRMACEDGQENHLTHLANDIDQRIRSMRAQFGEVGDMRLTIMAAITVADELSEAGGRIRLLEQANEQAQQTEAVCAELITTAAERIEKVAQALIHPPAA